MTAHVAAQLEHSLGFSTIRDFVRCIQMSKTDGYARKYIHGSEGHIVSSKSRLSTIECVNR